MPVHAAGLSMQLTREHRTDARNSSMIRPDAAENSRRSQRLISDRNRSPILPHPRLFSEHGMSAFFESVTASGFCFCEQSANLPGGGGVSDTDIVIYVTEELTELCQGGTLAYALSCQRDQIDRPVTRTPSLQSPATRLKPDRRVRRPSGTSTSARTK